LTNKQSTFFTFNGKAFDKYFEDKLNFRSSYFINLRSIFDFKNNNNLLEKHNFYLLKFCEALLLFNSIDTKKVQVANLIYKDMIQLNTMWRLAKGYPSKGQRTHSNGKMVLLERSIQAYRLSQFFFLFGERKRNIYPTLIQAEYTNRYWFYNWHWEWFQGKAFAYSLAKGTSNVIPFDPVRLAKNQTNGYIRTGHGANLGKARKFTNVATIGFPIFFSQYLYAKNLPRIFPFRILISDEDRRKMGRKKKIKKNKKK